MKTLVVVGHPNLNHSTINKAWTEAIQSIESEDLKVHILHESIQSNGSFDIKAEQKLIEAYDRIILQFPLYWYMVPDIMKRWMDQVWNEGWAYGEGGTKMEGKLLEIATSCGAPEVAFDEKIPGMRPLADFLLFLPGTAAFIRAKAGRTFALYGAESPEGLQGLPASCERYKEFVLSEPTA